MSQTTPKMLSAGFVIVRCREEHWNFLLLRAYRYWDFPKGQTEHGEAPLHAARREVREETALEDLALFWGDVYRETPPYGKGKVARFYVACSGAGEVRMSINPALGKPEHHEYRWLTYKDARRLLVPRLQAVIDWAHGIVGERCADKAV